MQTDHLQENAIQTAVYQVADQAYRSEHAHYAASEHEQKVVRTLFLTLQILLWSITGLAFSQVLSLQTEFVNVSYVGTAIAVLSFAAIMVATVIQVRSGHQKIYSHREAAIKFTHLRQLIERHLLTSEISLKLFEDIHDRYLAIVEVAPTTLAKFKFDELTLRSGDKETDDPGPMIGAE